jgi:hypothetical protein
LTSLGQNSFSNLTSIVTCSHDAGGAEVLSSFIKAKQIKSKFILTGPAVEIYKRKLDIPTSEMINTVPPNTDLVLASTGWSTDNEFNIIKLAKDRNIPVIAVLDHWFGYIERFRRLGKTTSPDKILVFDGLAEGIAQKLFPETQIITDRNYYVNDCILEHNRMINESSSWKETYDFLFLCEPRNLFDLKAHHEKYSDYDSLKYFFDVLKKLKMKKKRILLRLHPSEDSDKYSDVIPKDFSNVQIEKSGNLPLAIALSRYVVGCNTMAMVIALEIGKNVFSVVPPPFKTSLPFDKILPISELSYF